VTSGCDKWADFARLLKVTYFQLYLDVGANIGQTVKAVRRTSKRVRIHSFEPHPQTFQRLLKATAGDERTTCHQVALSSRNGEGRISDRPFSQMNDVGDEGLPCQLRTGDSWCAEHGIDYADYLKIDAEGHDLEVLKGFGSMVAAQCFDLIEVEVGLRQPRRVHVPLQMFRDYEGHPHELARANAVFAKQGELRSRRQHPPS
jgi:FkbM family methyltransferase